MQARDLGGAAQNQVPAPCLIVTPLPHIRQAMDFAAETLGFRHEDIVAAGDSGNDVRLGVPRGCMSHGLVIPHRVQLCHDGQRAATKRVSMNCQTPYRVPPSISAPPPPPPSPSKRWTCWRGRPLPSWSPMPSQTCWSGWSAAAPRGLSGPVDPGPGASWRVWSGWGAGSSRPRSEIQRAPGDSCCSYLCSPFSPPHLGRTLAVQAPLPPYHVRTHYPSQHCLPLITQMSLVPLLVIHHVTRPSQLVQAAQLPAKQRAVVVLLMARAKSWSSTAVRHICLRWVRAGKGPYQVLAEG